MKESEEREQHRRHRKRGKLYYSELHSKNIEMYLFKLSLYKVMLHDVAGVHVLCNGVTTTCACVLKYCSQDCSLEVASKQLHNILSAM